MLKEKICLNLSINPKLVSLAFIPIILHNNSPTKQSVNNRKHDRLFEKSRTISKVSGMIGDEIETTVLLNNTSEYDINSATVIETLSQGLVFKEGST